MKNYYQRFIPFLLGLCFVNCTEDGEGINQPPVADFSIRDMIDTYYLESSATDPDNNTLTYEWKSDSELISIKDPTKEIANFKLPKINESQTISLTLTVYDGQTSVTSTKEVQLPILTDIRSWGLGTTLEKESSSNVDYEWYMDQKGTGQHSYDNCGPTTATMAIKWFDKEFLRTPKEAREMYEPSGGWWNTHHIINYLNKYSVPNSTIELNNSDSLINELDKGNIIILCLDMYYIRNEINHHWRIDKFYKTQLPDWGHFIVLKGYKLVDNQLFFEAYDSGSWNARYVDNSLKGKNRYYRFSDLDKATNIWWDYAIIVSREKFKRSHGVDVEKIIHKYGS